jgi:hypothetical protein
LHKASAAASRFADVDDQTWVRLDGVPLSAPRRTLFDGSDPAAPLNLTSRGRYLWESGDDVITGSAEPKRPSDPGQDCMGWTSADPSLQGALSYGTSNVQTWWSDISETGACGYVYHVYCLEHDAADASYGGFQSGSPDGGAAGTTDAGADAPEAGAPGSLNYVFRTAATYPTQNRTFVDADAQCDAEAAYAGLPGSYRAWLSTTMVDARDRLTGARGWIRPDGLPFADTVTDLVQGRILAPLDVDPFGNRPTWTAVMTGTTSAGIVQAGATCHDWTDGPTAGTKAGEGQTWTTGAFWSSSTFDPCGHSSVLYCFGVSQSTPLAFPPSAGRLAFLSDSMFNPGKGLGAADALCNTDAALAGLAGSFAALLPTSTASAASRFADFEDSLWVRPDGVALNRPGERLFDMRDARLTLNVTASGVNVPVAYAIVGAHSLRAVPTVAETCDDWTSASQTQMVTVAAANYAENWFSGGTADCDLSFPVFCLQK